VVVTASGLESVERESVEETDVTSSVVAENCVIKEKSDAMVSDDEVPDNVPVVVVVSDTVEVPEVSDIDGKLIIAVDDVLLVTTIWLVTVSDVDSLVTIGVELPALVGVFVSVLLTEVTILDKMLVIDGIGLSVVLVCEKLMVVKVADVSVLVGVPESDVPVIEDTMLDRVLAMDESGLSVVVKVADVAVLVGVPESDVPVIEDTMLDRVLAMDESGLSVVLVVKVADVSVLVGVPESDVPVIEDTMLDRVLAMDESGLPFVVVEVEVRVFEDVSDTVPVVVAVFEEVSDTVLVAVAVSDLVGGSKMDERIQESLRMSQVDDVAALLVDVEESVEVMVELS
jgi:hypothetical protein